MSVKKQTKALEDMGVGERMRFLEELGAGVAKIVNGAVRRANNFLKPYNYHVTIDLKFHEGLPESKSQSSPL